MYQIYRIENDQLVINLNRKELNNNLALDLTVSALAERRYQLANKVLSDVSVVLLNSHCDILMSTLDLDTIKKCNIRIVIYPEASTIAFQGSVKRAKRLYEHLKLSGIKVTYRVNRVKAINAVNTLVKRDEVECERILKLI